jgi:hypothetical protein
MIMNRFVIVDSYFPCKSWRAHLVPNDFVSALQLFRICCVRDRQCWSSGGVYHDLHCGDRGSVYGDFRCDYFWVK